jgi:protein SCO1/2
MRIIICAALVLASACGRSALPFYRTSEMTPEWLGAAEASGGSMHRIAPFALTDQRGARLTNQSFTGKVSVVYFFFTACRDVCPTTTRNIGQLLRATGEDLRIQILSHSIAPGADSTGTLRRYAEERGIRDPRWHLLNGDSTAIDALARRSYFVRLGNDTTYGVQSIAHSESVLLVDGQGRLRGVYAGTLQLEMDRLKEDVETLLAEES